VLTIVTILERDVEQLILNPQRQLALVITQELILIVLVNLVLIIQSSVFRMKNVSKRRITKRNVLILMNITLVYKELALQILMLVVMQRIVLFHPTQLLHVTAFILELLLIVLDHLVDLTSVNLAKLV